MYQLCAWLLHGLASTRSNTVLTACVALGKSWEGRIIGDDGGKIIYDSQSQKGFPITFFFACRLGGKKHTLPDQTQYPFSRRYLKGTALLGQNVNEFAMAAAWLGTTCELKCLY